MNNKPTQADMMLFKSLQIGLASRERILEWSHGEVKKPETINYRTLKPEKEGLFCEKIFGPTKDWECYCGKYKRVRHKGKVCENCGVEVTRSKVRRERMGHIMLNAPVSHIWYFKGNPSRMGLLLDMSIKNLEQVLYYAAYVVTDPGDTDLEYRRVLNERELNEARELYGADAFTVGMGAEAIQSLLMEVDLEQEAAVLKEEFKESSEGSQKRVRIVRRLEAIESFRNSGNKPEWMILDVLPVIPPELRPMVQLDGGRFATSDLNDLYRRVINRNNRLGKLLELNAPEIIIKNEKRMLQEAVDALIDNGRRGRPVTGPGNRPFKSLSEILKGKQGRFRQNLLGKRVDYSGRSVIVVGPELKMYQCGLPKEMAVELFKPFVMHELQERGYSANIRSAKKMVERLDDPRVWDVLEDVIHEHPVLLNRAPTLHRLGIQAFEPVLVEGRAIKLHPLACTAFNADFDGDQMAVHVPLSMEAQAEARFLMMACNNILKPQDGSPVVVPSQDMILGTYYMTLHREDAKGTGSIFRDEDEMEMAYFNKTVDLHAMVKVRRTMEIDGKEESRLVESTVGRFLFNQILPQDMGFVKRETIDDMFKLEVDEQVNKKVLTKIVDKCFKTHGPTITSETLDEIKRLGYSYSTKAAITVGVADMQVPGDKEAILAEADKKVEKNLKLFRRGLISEEERYQNVIKIWNDATDDVTNALMNHLGRLNPINMMADSGARGSKNQIRQLAGMRGLMSDTTGRVIELPIRSNFREGLDVMEFFSSTHGARKGLADTALRTADSGYLTRRLVDVSQDVIIREDDCHSDEGYEVRAIREKNEMIEPLKERIVGRYAFEDVVNPETGEVIVEKDSIIGFDQADEIEKAGIESVMIRSILNCKAKHGLCRKCYGVDMTTWKPVNIGEAVGTIAAQSIGEPGTQLTMRTFHTGGVASAEDITQGLPRVEELFEARKPKGQAIISEIAGTVEIQDNGKKTEAVVKSDALNEERIYLIPYGAHQKVFSGEHVEAGQPLTEGSINPHDILAVQDIEHVQHYLLSEVQKVYRLQGVSISDKHVEVIVRQMLRKVRVLDAGDTTLLTGSIVDIFTAIDANNKALDLGLQPATVERILLGITKAALATDSFLSAASFQETTRVLTDAAIKEKSDPLLGLKENVIIGQLVPAGTGIPSYSKVQLDYDEIEQQPEMSMDLDLDLDLDLDFDLEDRLLSDDDYFDPDDTLATSAILDFDEVTGEFEKAVATDENDLKSDSEIKKAFDLFDNDFGIGSSDSDIIL